MINKTNNINKRLIGTHQSRSFIPIILLIVIQTSCKKLVDIPPPTQVLAENKIYSVDATAIGVMDGMYASLTRDNNLFQGLMSIGLLAGLSSDELTVFGNSAPYYTYYRNDLVSLASLSVGSDLWAPLYNYVYKSNAAVEGLEKATTLTPVIQQQLLGEAKFMRAFFYFYLVNLFGDVPLALSTDAVANSVLSRSPKTDVYNQILDDLKEAKDLMRSNYPNATLFGTTTERVRPTKWAAGALLARAYLFTGNYAKAEEEATAVINNSSLYSLLPALNNVFLKNSKEAIWQLQPTANNINTVEGRMYVIPPTGPSGSSNPVRLSNFLLNSFQPGDQRAVLGNWINTTIYKKTSTSYDTVSYSFKYKIYASPGLTSVSAMTEYFMVLRLGEQYLIRAEARARIGNNLSDAIDDLDKIRGRAGLPLIATTNPGIGQSALLDTILHERQVELFCEWGHRWLDLKRTDKVDAVMNVITPQKSNAAIAWRPYQKYYPIKKAELDKAPNLTQTPGY